MADELTEQIKQNAGRPAEATQDGTTMKQKAVSEVIEADRYLATRTAQGRKKTGLQFFKVVPPGA